jgi:hypothetical protein
MADRYNVKLTMIFWQIFNICSTISTAIGDLNRFWLSCVGPLVSCSLILLNYLSFQYFDIDRTWLFQKCKIWYLMFAYFNITFCTYIITLILHTFFRGRRGRDRIIVGFKTIYAISAYHHWCCEFESRSGRGAQHYVIKFVSDLRQFAGFLRVLRFPSTSFWQTFNRKGIGRHILHF